MKPANDASFEMQTTDVQCEPAPAARFANESLTKALMAEFPRLILRPGREVTRPFLPFETVAPALDLSSADWRRVLNAHCSLPSMRRQDFGETIEEQLMHLGGGVYDDCPDEQGHALSQRIAEMPADFKWAILEVIERFWGGERIVSSLEDCLHAMGLILCDTAHAQLAAYSQRRRLEAGRPAQAAEMPHTP